MKIRPISVYNTSTNKVQRHVNANYRPTNLSSPVFKGDRGATIGIFAGFAIGAGLTALTIATGGLAGVVAAVGSAGTTSLLGGAACTHLGGIAGGIIEEQLNKSDKKE